MVSLCRPTSLAQSKPPTKLDADTLLPAGGKHFSRDLRPLDADGNEISMWSADAKKKKDGEDGSSEDESSEEESEEEESENDAAGPSGAAAAELSREDRKKEKKARKDAALARARAQAVQVGDLPPSDSEESSDEDPMLANPNHSKASRNQAKAPVVAVDDAAEAVKKLAVSGTPSRRERESMEAAQAKERYRKMHEAGKTDEAKADIARLKLIREKREAESARKQVCDCVVRYQCDYSDHCDTGREGGARCPGGGQEGRVGQEGGQEARGSHGAGRQKEGKQEISAWS